MITPAKIALELALIVAALAILRFAVDTRRRRFFIGFAALTLVLNFAFYYIAAWPLYASYGETAGIGRSGLHAFVMFDVIKWGILAYILSRVATALADAGHGGGFTLLRSERGLGGAVGFGVLAGAVATAAVYGLSFLELRSGYLEALPWPFAKEDPAYLKLGLWGGVRNLAGEEILARLGAQSILAYAFRKIRGASILAIFFSSLYFEFWHNSFHELYLLNFTASCFFGWAYHKRGYESAAVAHCVADWLALVILPRLLF